MNIIMTTVYFVRHAESDRRVSDAAMRPLTEKGTKDSLLVTKFLGDKGIDHVISSPYKRAVDTITDFAEKNCLQILTIYDFRERKSDSDWNREIDYYPLLQKQWADFDYTLSDGEHLNDVQRRNINSLNSVLENYKDKNIVIATHGTALSTIINYYDKTYGFEAYMEMIDLMPWIVKMCFDGKRCLSIDKINLFE
ncbi:MAG: histidine phosphatase family protein [Ruminiclostridium sp.]|nr:histidine phosphatase family protein [Ruminiclostridium sp.]